MKQKQGRKPAPPTKLMKCPFCGYFAGKLSRHKDSDDEPMVYVVDCEACGSSGPVMGGNSERGRVGWNHRGGPPETFTAANRGTPESSYGDTETEEERDEREKAGVEVRIVEKAEPCPFCAGREVYVEEGHHGKKKEPYFYTFCGTCEACGPAHDTSEGFAILSWNIRWP